jgi:hypothetical protein
MPAMKRVAALIVVAIVSSCFGQPGCDLLVANHAARDVEDVQVIIGARRFRDSWIGAGSVSSYGGALDQIESPIVVAWLSDGLPMETKFESPQGIRCAGRDWVTLRIEIAANPRLVVERRKQE